MNVIGISAFNHNAACCLLIDGELIAAAEEERFSRIKHDRSLPVRAFAWCLEFSGLDAAQIDVLAYFEDPRKKLSRQLWSGLPQGFEHLRDWLDADRPAREIRERLGYDGAIEIVDHHHSHAASAFYFSGYDEAAVLTVDGVGEWMTTGLWHGRGERLTLLESTDFPNSLGLMYSTITAYLGFGVNDGEYKVMGLAAYGKPRYLEVFDKLVKVSAEGEIYLDYKYFEFLNTNRMYSEKLPVLFEVPPRKPGEPINEKHADVAASLQVKTEEVMLALAQHAHDKTQVDSLCLAGGVALNCVANRRILHDGPFDKLFVQPAAGDAGGALGAAAVAHRRLSDKAVKRERLPHVYLGPAYDNQFADELIAIGADDYSGREDELLEATAQRIADGGIIGWFQGRMEFGPRALGARSIFANPQDASMREHVNTRVKKRETFRPFAPAILLEHADEWFELNHASPFMTETCQVKRPESLQAVTHVDGTARVQTVDRHTAPRFAALLSAFERKTGCPVLLNTSFNTQGMPIVESPIDALDCFLEAELDALVLNDVLLDRSALPQRLAPYLRDLRSRAIDVRPRLQPVYTFF